MTTLPRPQAGLRRRLATMLFLIGGLVLVNIILVERQQAQIKDSSAMLARYADLYKLTRRIQGSLEAPGGEGRFSFHRFQQYAEDFDRDLEKVSGMNLAARAQALDDGQIPLLIEGLEYDWKRFGTAYANLRSAYKGGGLAGEQAVALVSAAEEVQASVVAITFVMQKEQLNRFAQLKNSIYALAIGDLFVLVMIMAWLRRRVVGPVERMAAAARRIGEADFSARVELVAGDSGDDEIGELGRLLDLAAGRIQGLLAEVAQETEALREAEAKFRALAEQSLLGIYMAHDGFFVYVNPCFAAIFGYDARELTARFPVASLIHVDDRPRVRDLLQQHLDEGNKSLRYEFKGVRKDGSQVPVEVLAAAGSYRGRPAVIGTLLDLSERKQSEAQIMKLSRAVEQSTASVVITDRGGVIEYVNPKLCAMTGYSADEVIGQTPGLFRSGLMAPEVYAEMWQRLLAGQEWHGEMLNRKKSGELFWESMVASPVRDAKGEITHFIAVKEDITARRQAEAELRRVNRTLKVLSACNQSLVNPESQQAYVDAICAHLVELGGFPLACIDLPDETDAQRVRVVSSAGPAAGFVEHWSDEEHGCGISGEAICRREIIVVRDIATDPVFAPWREEAVRYGLASAVAIPLQRGNEVAGALRIYATESDVFTTEELKLLKQLADDVGHGLLSFRAREQIEAQATELAIRQRAIESSRNGIMITRCDHAADNPIIYVNAAFETITGYARGEIEGRNARFLLGGHWEQPELERLRSALRRGGEVEVTLRNARKDGSVFWNDLSLSPVHDAQGQMTHFISIFNDVSERVRYQEELQHQVTHDTLTGLANRTLLNDRIEQALAHASRSNLIAAVLMIDLDRFNLINDNLGHPVGDALLRLVAARLDAVGRKGDTVARIGSDEFVIVLAGIDGDAAADEFVGKLEAGLALAFSAGEREVFVSASIGVSLAPRDGSGAEALLHNAEIAMHAVKSAGGNGHRIFSSEMSDFPRDRVGLETDLRRGMERGEFELFYQPKVSLRDDRIVGGEALIRWRHPLRGMVSPMQFIPLAEETGLIGAMGDWVIEQALRDLKTMEGQGIPPTKIAVNLSARQFRDHQLIERIRRLVGTSSVDSRWLELELTESMLMQRGEASVALLQQLRDCGFSLAIDDFGTGYSSLSYLQRFPIDTLKIDRAFVKDLETSHDSRVLAETILMMARNLGKDVVAEGVETMGQADVLRRAGCEVVQGFLYSRPVPLAEFSALLRREKLPPQAPEKGT